MSEMAPVDVPARPEPGPRRGGSFEEFYAAELPRLTALARGLSSAQAAEDIAQEAMLVAYRRWDEVSGLERPDLWVRRTCSNLAVSSFRRRLVEIRALTRLAGRRSAPVELSESSDEFWNAVRALPPRQAQSAALRFVYDMSMSEIAEVLGCTDGTVKQHLSRARAALATTLNVRDELREEQS